MSTLYNPNNTMKRNNKWSQVKSIYDTSMRGSVPLGIGTSHRGNIGSNTLNSNAAPKYRYSTLASQGLHPSNVSPMMGITKREKSIIKYLKNKDIYKVLVAIESYDASNREDFWKSYKINGKNILHFLKDEKPAYMSVIIGSLLGLGAYGACVFRQAIKLRDSKTAIGLLCFFHSIVKAIPTRSYSVLYETGMFESLSVWKDSIWIFRAIIETKRKQHDVFTNESLRDDVVKICEYNLNQQNEDLLELFCSVSTNHLAAIAREFYKMYGMTITQHGEHCNINYDVLTFLTHIIPLSISVDNYLVFLLHSKLKKADNELLLFYILFAISELKRNKTILDYEEYYGCSLLDELNKIYGEKVAEILWNIVRKKLLYQY